MPKLRLPISYPPMESTLVDRPLIARREHLEKFFARHVAATPVSSSFPRAKKATQASQLQKVFASARAGANHRFMLSPATRDRAVAQKWLSQSGTVLDGV